MLFISNNALRARLLHLLHQAAAGDLGEPVQAVDQRLGRGVGDRVAHRRQALDDARSWRSGSGAADATMRSASLVSSAEAFTASAGVSGFSSPSIEVSQRFTFVTSLGLGLAFERQGGHDAQPTVTDALAARLPVPARGCDDRGVRTRVAMIGLLLLVVAGTAVTTATVSSARPAAAQAVTTLPPTIVGRSDTECISANPRPDCEQSNEYERSSPRHLLLFGVLLVALVAIGTVVVRSTRRRDRDLQTQTGGPPSPDR